MVIFCASLVPSAPDADFLSAGCRPRDAKRDARGGRCRRWPIPGTGYPTVYFYIVEADGRYRDDSALGHAPGLDRDGRGNVDDVGE